MACALTLGRTEPCKEQVGGLDKVYFINYSDTFPSTITYDLTNTDAIESVSGTPSAYSYEIKGASSFTQNIVSDRNNGTTYYEQVLEITLKQLSIADHKELRLLAAARPHVIVKDNNDNYFLAGLEHGMDVTGGTIVTGTEMGDLSGYTLTLTAMERKPANFLEAAPATVGFTVV